MERIDKFIYINLDKRKDRNEHIIKELKRFNVPDDKIIRLSAIESEKGAYGCALSHLKAIQMFKESGDKTWCILEDDHYFTQSKEETDNILNSFFNNEEYDAFIGCYCNVRGYDLSNGVFRRVTRSSMTSFYIIKNNLCDALIASNKESARTLNPKNGKKSGIPCDFMWANVMKVFWFVAPYKPFGAQLLDYSNIRNKVMNYSNYIGHKIDRDVNN